MDSWKAVGVVTEDERINVSGVNPWNHEWHATGQKNITLPHPIHSHQLHEMDVYEIQTGGRFILFTAGEVSANVWAFYVPT